MNAQNTNIDPEQVANDGVATPPASRSRLGAFWFGIRMLEVRLRFIAVLVVLGLVIGYWDTMQNYWDRWTRPAVAVSGNASSDTEFYCPMDPSVIKDGLEPNQSIPKCPICGMPLSLRKKGTPMTLPPGIVGRVTLTADRVQMAGIRTSEIGIRPMNRVIRAVGAVAYNQSKQSQIVTRIGGYLEKLTVDRTFMKVSQGDPLAEIYSPELYAAIQELKIAQDITGSSLAKIAREKVRLLGIDDQEIDGMLNGSAEKYRVVVRSPVDGYVIQKMVQQGASVAPGQLLFEIADLSSVWIEADIYEREIALLHEGQEVITTVEAYSNRQFSGMVALIYPEMQVATRTNRVRFEIDNSDLLLKAGMYATVNFQTAIQHSEPFQTILVSSQQPPADPAAAILQQSICPVTGAKLGSMGDPIPVVARGQTVYLCCAGCKEAVENRPEYYLSRIRTVTQDGVLAVPETAVIDTGNQKIVYVEREQGVFEGLAVQLGPKVDGFYSVISGLLPGDQVAAAGAFLIDAETRLNPAASAAYFGAGESPSGNSAESTSRGTVTGQVNASPTRFTSEELANIEKLSAEEQELARRQVLCPITEMALGSMGVPLSIMVGAEKVMICCEGCTTMAQRDPVGTMKKLNLWKSENQQAKQ